MKELESQLCQCLDYYNEVLGRHEDGIGGGSFGLVDMLHMPMIEMLATRLGYEHEIISPKRANLKEWWMRVTQRPSWKTVKAKASGQ